ncbi:MAG TPA: cell division FtsA domain-containing protein [Bacilli bacterium]|nr:cell division FtsA domain-containing protein [Bacilli bacterium]
MKKIFASIDIGFDTTRVLVGEYFQDKVNILAVSSVKSKGIENGLVVDQDAEITQIKLALLEIEEKIGVKVDKAIVTIPSNNAEYNILSEKIKVDTENNIVDGSTIIKLVNKAVEGIVQPNMELVSTIPIDFNIYKEDTKLETVKDPKGKMCDELSVRLMAITVPKSNVLSIVGAVENSGIEVIDICLDVVADFEQIKRDDYEKEVCGVINIGKSKTNLSIFNKGIVTNNTIINIGSKVIDEDIAYVFYTTKKEAKRIKENFGIANPKFTSKEEVYETIDVNGKKIRINEFELSEIINKRLVEILNISKNELKVLTNKQISYIMVIGGIADIPEFTSVVEDVFKNGITYNLNEIGIRKNKYISALGAIKFFIFKLKLRAKDYTMFSKEDIINMLDYKKSKNGNSSFVSKIIDYFFQS